jgi:predicted metal-binding membrane protein
MEMSGSPWSAGALGSALVMWTVMMAAMMLPSALPIVRLVAGSNRRAVGLGAADTPPALFVAGYLLTWTGFSALATSLQALLRSLALLTSGLSVSDPRLGGAILLLTGTYQLTRWKGSCLAHCQSPASFLLLHWREGARGALVMGVRHGLFCIGCCWALMLVLFVVGVMNLWWVAALAVVIALEKLALGGRWLPRIAGLGLMLWGAVLLITDAGVLRFPR